MSVIYGLIDGESLELRYVGQTYQPLGLRFAQHRRASSTDNQHLKNWFRARPANIITLERNLKDLNAAEIKWIAGMRMDGARLINMTEGGDKPPSPMGVPKSAETRAKISAARVGRVMSVETRAKIGAAHRGVPLKAEHRAKLSAALMGHSVSAEARTKISVGNTGKMVSVETRAKISAAMKRGV